jgi:hypothetical protein
VGGNARPVQGDVERALVTTPEVSVEAGGREYLADPDETPIQS